MTAFIKQEATEKAREIEIKANEEFAIEKSKLVRQETDTIDATYSKKFKQATMSQQIARSTVANKTRLRVLAARQELLDSIFETAGGRVKEGVVGGKLDRKKYQEVLKNLLLEAAYALREGKLSVRARKADFEVVKKAVGDAEGEYKEEVEEETKLVLDESDPLPEGSSGGVIVSGGGGKIVIDNTFDTRLKLLSDSALPDVRKTLFGDNPNRKFYD